MVRKKTSTKNTTVANSDDRMKAADQILKMDPVSLPPGHIDISGLDRAEILAALYNRSAPQGTGFLQYKPGDMAVDEARTLLAKYQHFDYLEGRVMKIIFRPEDHLRVDLYDRDVGQGAAASVIAALRAKAQPPARPDSLLAEKAAAAQALIGQPTTTKDDPGGIRLIHLGLEDMEHVLGPAVRAALDNDDYERDEEQ